MRALTVLALLPLLGTVAWAERKPPPRAVAPPDHARAVHRAYTAGDEAKLKALAHLDGYHLWLVAEELGRRGLIDAALALAKANGTTSAEGLPAYLESRRGAERDTALAAALRSARVAFQRAQYERVVAVAEGVTAEPKTVGALALRVLHLRALAERRRKKEALKLLPPVIAGAERIGWTFLAALMNARGQTWARDINQLKRAAAYGRRAVEIHGKLGDRFEIANAWAHLGNTLRLTGDARAALAAYRRMREYEDALPPLMRAHYLQTMGSTHWMLLDAESARALHREALPVWEKHGHRVGIASEHMHLAQIAASLGDLKAAHALIDRAVKELGDPAAPPASVSHHNARFMLGGELSRLGDYDRALTYFRAALRWAEDEGSTRAKAMALARLSNMHIHRGSSKRALMLARRALGLRLPPDEKGMHALLLTCEADAHRQRGDLRRAVPLLERSLRIRKELDDERAVANLHTRLSNVHMGLGNLARALRHAESGVATYERHGMRLDAAVARQELGLVRSAMGDREGAIRVTEDAAREQKALGARRGYADSLQALATDYVAVGRGEEALEAIDEAIAILREVNPRTVVLAIANKAYVLAGLGRHEEALRGYDAVIERVRKGRSPVTLATNLTNRGNSLIRLGKLDEALKELDEARRLFRRIGARASEVSVLGDIAAIWLRKGENEKAFFIAEGGIEQFQLVTGGLDEGLGASLRGRLGLLHQAGALAAARTGRFDDMVQFLERGRATGLLESLGGSQVFDWDALPQDLRESERAHKEALNRARAEVTRLRERGATFDALREARKRTEAAEKAMVAVVGRIQREAKHQAGFLYPRVAVPMEIQSALADGQVLVMYGLCVGEAVAALIRPDRVEAVRLGSVADLRARCEALDASNTGADPSEALGALKKLIVDPLKLGADVREVIVSPEGPLSYVPFGAVFDRPVTLTSSGTTHVLLASETFGKGSEILALGAPDYEGKSSPAAAVYYRGRTLRPLPATREEATRIGTTTLLGPKANEEALPAALEANRRWRAVHFACHGLVDPERPALASLALSATEQTDGFLTMSEVLRMKIPADLVALSACETGTGKIVRGEGILGLSRAFFYAGTPRVLCSLWKVDDEATQALMVKFYELWNPKEGKGVGAARALARAQEHVRGQEHWKHPYYWAAWVLWGLPQ